MRALIYVSLIFLMLSCSDNTGNKLPAFTAYTLSGKKIDTKHLAGKIVVIKIWATWCGSCVKEIPDLNALVEKYKNDSSIVFLSITEDNREKIELFLTKRPFAYEHITDAKKLQDRFYGGLSQEIPKHLVVDKNGNIVFDKSGELPNIALLLSTKIDEIK